MTYSDTNVGTINAKTGSHAGTIVGQIPVGISQSLMALYTVPANCTAYLLGYTTGVGKLDDATVSLFARSFGENFRIQNQMEVYQSTQAQTFFAPLEFSEKTDLDFRATGTSGNSSCIVNFDVVLHNWGRVE